jgi:hypothetical protein
MRVVLFQQTAILILIFLLSNAPPYHDLLPRSLASGQIL